MTERFIDEFEDKILDNQTGEMFPCNSYTKPEIIKKMNTLHEENQQFKKTLRIIADAESARKSDSVKEILRDTLFGLDSVAGESVNAWNDYIVLDNFFKEYYNGEYWDSDKYD